MTVKVSDVRKTAKKKKKRKLFSEMQGVLQTEVNLSSNNIAQSQSCQSAFGWNPSK
jgi:hypothetical protein